MKLSKKLKSKPLTPEIFNQIDPPSADKRMVVMGTAPFVTSCFGMTCASVAVRTILGEKIEGMKNKPKSWRLPPEPKIVPMIGGKDSADD